MENGAFSAGPADSLASEGAESTPQSPPPLEMTPPSDEKQPLCQCDTHCSCLEVGGPPAGRAPNVTVEAWSRTKTVVMAVGLAALVVWCGIMAVMHHYGVL